MSANSLYLSLINNINIGSDDEKIINSDAYLNIRENINRRFNDTNWKKTKELSEEINKKTGMNTMSAIYYTIAITKTDGLKGLACGLEILLAAMSQKKKREAKKSSQNEAINWMFRMVKDDIKSFSLDASDLRELYRCERACTGIEESIGSGTSPNLGITQTILSTAINTLQSSNNNVINKNEAIKNQWTSKIITLLLITFFTMLMVFFHQQINISLRDIASYYYPHSNSSLAKDLHSLEAHYGIKKVAKVKPIFINNQLQRIDHWISLGDSKDLMLAKKMLEEIENAYGITPKTSQRRILIEKNIEQLQGEFGRLTQRFINNRTQLANLSLSIDNIQGNNIKQIKDQSTAIKNYAIGLSPFIGRAEYIDQQIKQGNIERATTEIAILKKRISSLQLKIITLEKKSNRAL